MLHTVQFPGPIAKESNNESVYVSTIKVLFAQVDGILFLINCKNDAVVMHLGDTLLVVEGGTGKKAEKVPVKSRNSRTDPCAYTGNMLQ